MASGVLERHASVAGSSAGTARAPPAGLGPTPPARDASTRRALRAPARAAPSAPPPPSSRGVPGSRSRRSLLAPGARALDRVRHELLASPRLNRCQNRYVDGRDALDLADERLHRPAPAARARGAQTPAAGDDRPEEPRQVGGRPGQASRDDSKCLMSVAARSPIERLLLVAAPTRPPLPPRVPEVDRVQRSRSQGPGAPGHGRPRSRPSARPPSFADPAPPA